MTQQLIESQNMYESHTDTTILSWRLYDYFACCLCLFLSSFFVNATTTNTLNVDEWFESIEAFISINKYFSKFMHLNEKAYESNIFRMLWVLLSTLYSHSLQNVLKNQFLAECEWIRVVEFKFCWLTHITLKIALNQDYPVTELWNWWIVTKIAWISTSQLISRNACPTI